MLSHKLSIIAATSVLVAACQSPANVKELEVKNSNLQNQLTKAQQEIVGLQTDKKQLMGEISELKRVMGVLDTEKNSRVEESLSLRTEVRQFVQAQVDSLKAFMVASDLLDYVGGELVQRSNAHEGPGVLVDLGNRVPRAGSLSGVAGFFTGPTSLKVYVLRPVDDRYVVIWGSNNLTVAGAGEQRVEFGVSVGIQQGDVIAYDFNGNVNVTFDKGTGATALSSKSLQLGTAISPSSLKNAKEKRAYSLGVFAILK